MAQWVERVRADGGLLSSIMKHGRIRMSLRVDNPCELPDLDTYRRVGGALPLGRPGRASDIRNCRKQRGRAGSGGRGSGGRRR